MKNRDMPAMPIFNDSGSVVNNRSGLTKREHFAGLAMQGLLLKMGDYSEGTISKLAILQADALLEALEADNDNTSK